MPSALLLLPLLLAVAADFCGPDKIPYGFEVHKSGVVRLLCSRPNCFEKHYSECPERPESKTCSENDTWVGGLEKTIDGRLVLTCCWFEDLPVYGNLKHSDIIVRAGEFYEGDEKTNDEEDVLYFDVITNIEEAKDRHGPYYKLTVYRYNCENEPEKRPEWFKRRQWPYWQYSLF
ncbi:unnamed protein product [Caenorhabditis auriculariae]|uniref:Uncharacterized protein n=1 Tax=Caenorhabditis auriculariae TaxID=2777116 RepID=A0A8S1HC88_9PELO|nr:unnamed protein product [Caenorhabditis auriculariae]